MVSGRKDGNINKKLKYRIHAIDVTIPNPQWESFDCTTYQSACETLQNKYHISTSRNVLQNILLNRLKIVNHQNIKIELLNN